MSERIKTAREAQRIEELRRKACKAVRMRGRMWTQEELDYIKARADSMAKKLVWD